MSQGINVTFIPHIDEPPRQASGLGLSALGAPLWPGHLSVLPWMAEAFGTLLGAAAVVLQVPACSVGTRPV